ncbi:MAG: ribonuclease P protein component [Bacteroidales bacterium]|nr:ribonuclease P protein component [Bacteroidales bacterium]
MNTFKKKERLKSKKIINSLFTDGNSYVEYPYRILWGKFNFNSPFPAQFGISVSKKKFKKAVDRNLIKRRTKEAYRKNKYILYDFCRENGIKIAVMIVYIANDIILYSEIEKKIILILKRLICEIEKELQKTNI